MKKQASIWLVVTFLIMAIGIVYALSTTSPSQPENDKAPIVSQEPASVAAGTPAGEDTPRRGLTPDLTKVDAYQFLDPVPVGRPAPDFSAKTADGTPVKLSDFEGRKNVVLVFYQGSFCSVCGAQLSNIQKHLSDFRAQDAEVIAISADDAPHAMQSVGEHGLTFPVVPDAEKEVIEKFGVGNISKRGIAWPSLFVVDKQGVVQLSYASREGHRMHSNEILPVLSKITGKPAPQLDYSE